ncbi:MAG TPA: hypothetical protein VGE86_05365 [Thermoanaerobaculia bacterium]
MKWDSKLMAARAASIAAVWGMEKFLSTPAGKKTAHALDRKVTGARKSTVKTVRSGVRNARSNAAWAAAGALALGAAAVFFGTATRKR